MNPESGAWQIPEYTTKQAMKSYTTGEYGNPTMLAEPAVEATPSAPEAETDQPPEYSAEQAEADFRARIDQSAEQAKQPKMDIRALWSKVNEQLMPSLAEIGRQLEQAPLNALSAEEHQVQTEAWRSQAIAAFLEREGDDLAEFWQNRGLTIEPTKLVQELLTLDQIEITGGTPEQQAEMRDGLAELVVTGQTSADQLHFLIPGGIDIVDQNVDLNKYYKLDTTVHREQAFQAAALYVPESGKMLAMPTLFDKSRNIDLARHLAHESWHGFEHRLKLEGLIGREGEEWQTLGQNPALWTEAHYLHKLRQAVTQAEAAGQAGRFEALTRQLNSERNAENFSDFSRVPNHVLPAILSREQFCRDSGSCEQTEQGWKLPEAAQAEYGTAWHTRQLERAQLGGAHMLSYRLLRIPPGREDNPLGPDTAAKIEQLVSTISQAQPGEDINSQLATLLGSEQHVEDLSAALNISRQQFALFDRLSQSTRTTAQLKENQRGGDEETAYYPEFETGGLQTDDMPVSSTPGATANATLVQVLNTDWLGLGKFSPDGAKSA